MIIEGDSVAECWFEALTILVKDKKRELSPLIMKIKVTDSHEPFESELEIDINDFLTEINQPSIEATAGTIFPISLAEGTIEIYERYNSIWPKIKKNSKNKRGTYFRRLTAYGEHNHEPVNQLKEIIETYNGVPGVRLAVRRRSALIATIFDPTRDHTHQPQLGFPCLQQVCFIPNNGQLSMNAIYAMQYLSNRAYGNYLGLMRLGKFMADQMSLEFTELNCMISILELGKMNKAQAKIIVDKYS